MLSSTKFSESQPSEQLSTPSIRACMYPGVVHVYLTTWIFVMRQQSVSRMGTMWTEEIGQIAKRFSLQIYKNLL